MPLPPPCGRWISSPVTYSLLPGSTTSRLPPAPCWNVGSFRSRDGIEMLASRSASAILRPAIARATASRTCAR